MQTKGKCIYCGNLYAGRGLSRHLATHLKDEPAADRKKSFHLVADAKPYFLHLLMDGDAQLDELDEFLRAIWLECCGHMSQFSSGRWSDKISLSTKCRRAFDKDVELWYAYDFGSTTEFTIRCVGVYPIATKEGIKLLTRNEPLDIPCDHCKKKQATELCNVHYQGEEMFFCDDCTEQHEKECEDAEYAMMPVVNSPRMGVCGYTGGSIDLERDQAVTDE
ncbi:MAG: hypothetical protein J5I98_14015 [Phaeodactylibacter sp.]|nr:hypothetical protein [Phaeodactylibacter sp.]